MPLTLSDITLQIAPSATLALDARVKEMKAANIDVIGFAGGEPDFDTPAPIREAMKEAMDQGMTRYTPASGTFALRDAVSARMKEDYDLTYERSEIVISNGAKHALYNIFQAIINPGDEVIIPTPCWVSYPEMVRMAGGVPVFVESSEYEDFVPCLNAITSAVTEKTKAFILTNPSNPNGNIWTKEQLLSLGNLAVEKGFYIISDEIYDKLVFDGRKHTCIATLSEAIKAQTLLVNGVSKSYAMTGFRIGYTCGAKPIMTAIGNYQSQSTSAPNSAAQHAATVALTMDQHCVEEMRQAFEERRNELVRLINEIEGIHCQMPEGAFYVMMNVQDLFGKKIDGKVIDSCDTFAALLLEKAHVAMVPGNAFMAKGFCRLSYATSMQQIREGMHRLADFVKELEP